MIKNVVDQMRYGVIPKHRHDRELLEFFADRIEEAVEQGIQHCGNAAKMCEALKAEAQEARDVLIRESSYVATLIKAAVIAKTKRQRNEMLALAVKTLEGANAEK